MYIFYLLAIYTMAEDICKVVEMNTKAEIALNLTNVLKQVISKQFKPTISNVVYLVLISYKLSVFLSPLSCCGSTSGYLVKNRN